MDNLRKDIVFDHRAPGANGIDAKGGEPSLLSSSSLKDFEILSKLGQGSFGIVYRVRRRSDRSLYVLKQINLGNLDNRAKRDAVNEAKILATLECPHIVKYYDSFLEKSTLNIILEYCEGGDIYRIIKTQMGKFFAESKIWKYFIQMAAGLNYLHRNKILHRDLKSMNIFLTKDGEVRIGDLGVAKQLGESANFANTMVGTPYYLSPEMCEEKPYNEKSDVWALGCVLYEICTFRHPFEASNQAALIFKIIKGRYIPVSTAFYSQDLCDIVDWLLSRDYRKRPSTSQILAKPIVMAKAAQYNIQLPGSTGANITTTTSVPAKEPATTTTVPAPKPGPKDRKPAPPVPIQKPAPIPAPPVSTGQSTNAMDETTNTTAIFNENGVKGGDGMKDHLEKLKAEFFSSKDNDLGPIQVAVEKARGVMEKVGRQPPQPLPEVIKKPAPAKVAPPPPMKVEMPPSRVEPPQVPYVVEEIKKPAAVKVTPSAAKVELPPSRIEPTPVKIEPIPQPASQVQPVEDDSPQGHQYQAPKISPPKVVVKKTGVEFFVSMKDDGSQQALPQPQVPIYVPPQIAPTKSGGIAAMKKPIVVPMNEYVEEKSAIRKPVVAPVNEFDDRTPNVVVMKKPVLVPANEYADDKRDVKRVRKGAPKGLARNAGGSYSNNHKQKLVKMEQHKALPKINRPKTNDANQLLAMQQNGITPGNYRNIYSRENSGDYIPVSPITTSTKLEEIAEVANLPNFRRKNKNGECQDSDQEDSLEVFEQQNHQYHHQFIIENPSDYLREQMIAETIYEPKHQSPQTVTNGFYNGGECEWKVSSPQRRPESSGGSRPQSKAAPPVEQESGDMEDDQPEPEFREEDMDHDSLEGEDSYGAKIKGEFIKSSEDQLKDDLIKIREVEAHIKLRTNQVLMEVPENNWNTILNFCRRKIESDEDLNDKDQDELDYMIQKYVPTSDSTPLVIENIFRIIALENQASKLRENIKRLKFELIE